MKKVSTRILLDRGLLSAINAHVLHPVGLALALEWDSDSGEGEPDRVVLLESDSPTGIVYDKELFHTSFSKYNEYLKEKDEVLYNRMQKHGGLCQSQDEWQDD